MDINKMASIANTPLFQQRVDSLVTKLAVYKLSLETPPSADLILGQKILDGKEPILPWAYAVLYNETIAAGAHTDDGGTIADGDLETAINALWLPFSL